VTITLISILNTGFRWNPLRRTTHCYNNNLNFLHSILPITTSTSPRWVYKMFVQNRYVLKVYESDNLAVPEYAVTVVTKSRLIATFVCLNQAFESSGGTRTRIGRQILVTSYIWNFTKPRPMGGTQLHVNGRMDRQDKAISLFSQLLCYVPKIVWHSAQVTNHCARGKLKMAKN